MAAPDLPPEIISLILCRLPVKPIFRFKCVAKSWQTLLNSPNFIKLHLNQTLISNNYPNLITSLISLYSTTISDHNSPNFRFSELNHPLNHQCDTSFWSQTTVAGSCDGLVCISTYDKKSIYLYNPSTKKHRLIPPFTPSSKTIPFINVPIFDPFDLNMVALGFGYDNVRDDYKLVRLIQQRIDREASVYSLRINSWKCLNDDTPKNYLTLPDNAILYNGVLHFLVAEKFGAKHQPFAKCYDLGSETFKLMNLPRHDRNLTQKVYNLKELGGGFCATVNYQNLKPGASSDSGLVHLEFWVMKEYGKESSWAMMFRVPDPAMIGGLELIRPLVYSKDGRKILLEVDGSSFGWYDWGSKDFKKVAPHGVVSADVKFQTWTFFESLVSFDDEKSIEKTMPRMNKKRKFKDTFLSSGFKLKL